MPCASHLRPALFACALLALAACRCVNALDPGKDFHHYVRDSWSIEQGLPQISALAIAQDTQGYLWIGTQAGLARFDGHRFISYTRNEVPELPGAYINDLLSNGDGRLWIATYKGLAVHERGRFRSLPHHELGELKPLNILDLEFAADGSLLAVAGDGLYGVQGEAVVLQQRLSRPAYSLLADADAVWIGSSGGVFRLLPGLPPSFLPLPSEADAAAVNALLWAQGRLWAGSSEGLFWFDGESWRRYAEDADLANAPIEALHLDRDGNLWVAELAHLTRLRDGLPRERIDPGETALSVRTLFEDRDGQLWLGSQWYGVTRLRNGWTRRYSLREGLHTPLLWSVAEADDGSLWVGSDDGLSHFREGRFEQRLPGSALPHPNAYTLRVEGDTLWIGTRRGLVLYQDGEVKRPAKYDPLLTAQINGIVRDRDGRLWFATTTGLYREQDDRLQRFAEAEGLTDPRVRQIFQTRAGELLIGTHAGLYRFDNQQLHRYGVEQGLPAGLDITAILEPSPGRLVIGTLAEQLYIFDGRRWQVLGPEQGMPANAAFYLAHDADYLWVAGIRGVQRAPMQDVWEFAAGRRARVRGEMLLNERGDRRGGQKGYCCNGAGHAKGLQRGDQLWAPTRDGLVVLNGEDVRYPDQPPNTLIERLRVAGQWREVDSEAVLELQADQRDLAIEFTGIDFADPRSVAFRYRLLGYHDDWREPDEIGSRVVSYTNLPPGDYRFEVQGSSRAEHWSPSAQLRFSIAPTFVETGAFTALLALAALIAIGLGYRYQRHRYARRAEKLEHLVQQRTEALAEANQRLQEASHTDPLTHLRNRRYLALQIPKDLAYYDRELRSREGRPQVIVFAVIDIDHFKHINDDYGHGAGDKVLAQFADVLRRQVRGGDYVARWGGEEFLIVFRPTPCDYLSLLGERVRAAVAAEPFEIGLANPLHITCSIGLVEYPLFHDSQASLAWEQLIELADRALYHVKRHGRNGWAAYRPARGVSVERVLELLRLDEAEFEASSDLQLIGSSEQAIS